MASFYYNPFADNVSIEYKCPHCGHHNSETIDVPMPDWCAESHHDSVNSDYTELYCGKCGSEFHVTVRPQELMIGDGYFTLLYPQDGHMPQLCVDEPEMVKKVVVKVKLNNKTKQIYVQFRQIYKRFGDV